VAFGKLVDKQTHTHTHTHVNKQLATEHSVWYVAVIELYCSDHMTLLLKYGAALRLFQ
jgi:hypothetical protein